MFLLCIYFCTNSIVLMKLNTFITHWFYECFCIFFIIKYFEFPTRREKFFLFDVDILWMFCLNLRIFFVFACIGSLRFCIKSELLRLLLLYPYVVRINAPICTRLRFWLFYVLRRVDYIILYSLLVVYFCYMELPIVVVYWFLSFWMGNYILVTSYVNCQLK